MIKRLLFTFIILLSLIYSGFAITPIGDCSSTFVANTPGELYELTGNLTTTNTCINVGADDIIIDCKGYNISGDYSAKDFGINITSTDNVTIRNCNIYNFDMSLMAYKNTNLNIENNLFYDANNRANILWSGNNDTTIINNVFDNPSDNAGTFYPISYAGIGGLTNIDSYNVLFEGNTILNTNYDGIWVDGDYNWTYKNNYFFNTTYSIYAAYDSLVVDNVFNYSYYPDKFIYNAQPGSRIINNTFINNSDAAFGGFNGDYYYIEGNTFIDIETLFNNLMGVTIYFGQGNTFTNVNYIMHDTLSADFNINESMTFPSGDYLLYDTDNDGLLTIDNDNIDLDCNNANFTGNMVGIAMKFVSKDNISIRNCRLNTYDTMIEMDGGVNITIEDNFFFDSDNENIAMNGVNNSKIINNNFDNPSETGALIYEISGAKPSNYFNLFDNNIITNTNYDGVYMMGDFNWTFTNNNFFNSSYGVYACTNCLVQNNIFNYSSVPYEFIYESDTGSKIIGNTFLNNSHSRIFNHYGGDEFYFQNNIFKDINVLFDKVEDLVLNFISGNTLQSVNYVINDPTAATAYITQDSILPQGNYLMYDTDTDGAFRINQSDIIFNCNGANITGNGVGYGIRIDSGADNVTIINCNIHNYVSAIFIADIGYPNPNLIYNNLFNVSGDPINEDGTANNLNNSLGGNFWANSTSGAGFSQTCTDADVNGICDSSYSVDINNVDYLPLASAPSLPISPSSSTSASGINYVLPTPNNNAKVTYNSIVINMTYDGESVSNCQLNLANGSTYPMTSGSDSCYATLNLEGSNSYTYNISYDLSSTAYYLSNRIITKYSIQTIDNQTFPSIGIGSLITSLMILAFVLFI